MPSGSNSLLIWVAIIGVFYVFLIRPEKTRQKKMKNMMDELKVGDKIMTKGGVIGTIALVYEDNLILESGPDKTKIEFSRLAVGSILAKAEDVVEDKLEETQEEVFAGEISENQETSNIETSKTEE